MNEASPLQEALSEAIRHLGADSGTLHLREAERPVLRLAASQSIPEPVLAIVREVPFGKGMAGLAAERAEPVDACNIQTDVSGDVRPGARATGLQGAIVVPILRGGEVLGTLGVGCRGERVFTPEETIWLMEFARGIGKRLPPA